MKLLKLIPLSLFFVVNFSPFKVISHSFTTERDCKKVSKDCIKLSRKQLDPPHHYEAFYQHGNCLRGPKNISHSYSKSKNKAYRCNSNFPLGN